MEEKRGLNLYCCRIQFKDFAKFEDTEAALNAASSMCDGELNKDLKKFLKKSIVKKGLEGEPSPAEYGG